MYNKEISAVVFCGGFGRRMEDLTQGQEGCQKCMIAVEGDPILVHI
jgi:NDP-sugar pyrophosphorylase family protein